MKQRTEDERVAELQAKIEAIRQRGQRKRARANPTVRLAAQAAKLIDKAARETDDEAARKALADARSPLASWLEQGGHAAPVAVEAPVKPTKRRKNNVAMSIGT